MSNFNIEDATAPTDAGIFSDPVGYLARFGIEACLVEQTALPDAA